MGWEASLGMPIAHACTDPGFPNRHSAAGQKANLGSPAFSGSLLLTCQFSSYSSPGTLMGPGRYQRCTLHTEHLIDCKYSPTVLLSQPPAEHKVNGGVFFQVSVSPARRPDMDFLMRFPSTATGHRYSFFPFRLLAPFIAE